VQFYSLHNNESINALKDLPDNSIDSLVTDPPAGIAFLGKSWDSYKDREQFISEMQAIFTECLRVLKPGSHGLVWAIPRTSHWTAYALENAGFEVRDKVYHIQGMGFPKSLNIGKALDKQGKLCQCRAYETKTNMPNLSEGISTKEQNISIQSEVLQQGVLCKMESTESTGSTTPQENSESRKGCVDRESREKFQPENVQREQPCMEGWQIHRAKEGLCGDTQPDPSESKTERICAGTCTDNGKENQANPSQGGDNSSYQPQHTRQSTRELNIVQDTQGTLGREPQDRLYCSECGKIKRKEVEGLGTGLKPAAEEWILIRKPISENTIAENVIKWGVGGINIDGCRIEGKPRTTHSNGNFESKTDNGNAYGKYQLGIKLDEPQGRFPSNLVLSHSEDCTDEQCSLSCAVRMLDEQSGPCKTGELKGQPRVENKIYGSAGNTLGKPRFYIPDAATGASRFFYCAKISPSERNAGLEDMPDKQGGIKNASGRGFSESDPYKQIITKNNHPTVKTKKLMTYLIKLITPPNGLVLDPFMGSGSTGIAALAEGFRFIGIEKEKEYYDIAKARIEHA